MVYHFGVNFVASLFCCCWLLQHANVTPEHQEHTAFKRELRWCHLLRVSLRQLTPAIAISSLIAWRSLSIIATRKSILVRKQYSDVTALNPCMTKVRLYSHAPICALYSQCSGSLGAARLTHIFHDLIYRATTYWREPLWRRVPKDSIANMHGTFFYHWSSRERHRARGAMNIYLHKHAGNCHWMTSNAFLFIHELFSE